MTGLAKAVVNIPNKKPLKNLVLLKDWYSSFFSDSGDFLMRSTKSAHRAMNRRSEKT
jgi:hypothetical protein